MYERDGKVYQSGEEYLYELSQMWAEQQSEALRKRKNADVQKVDTRGRTRHLLFAIYKSMFCIVRILHIFVKTLQLFTSKKRDNLELLHVTHYI